MTPDPAGVVVFDHSSAFGWWGGVMVELIHFHRVEPSSAATALVRDGLHHVTWFADSLDTESQRLVDVGWPVVLTATTAGGVTFTLHDARSELGHFVEIYERSPVVAANYERVRRASLDWDRNDPVRTA